MRLGEKAVEKLKVLCAFGTRPEAIKMAPLIKALGRVGAVETRVCVTAQHRRMLDEVLDAFGIRPDYDLDIMRAGQTLADITTRVLAGMDRVYKKAAPDLVLVHGDTTTTFASALAAYYHKIPVGHVEAGLRTYDKHQPYPEEMNRRFIAPLADLNFAPTTLAKQNLLSERADPASIFVTGNTVIDVIPFTVSPAYRFRVAALNKIDYKKRRVIFMTAHRRENCGKPLESIFSAVKKIACEFDDILVVYPVHLNPAVRGPAEEILGGVPRVLLVEPLGLYDAHNIMARSYMALTDSGGIQEEAPFLGKPVLVLRNVTERPEGVAAGCIKIAGNEGGGVYDMVKKLLTDKDMYAEMARAPNPFGDGKASERIVAAVLRRFGLSNAEPEEFAAGRL
jgi:UDP-N-acetylglucosamine 2-epimerase (non-hydrolysing)